MKQGLVSIVAGLLFGFGLALAQMTDPAKVIDFLDFSGTWDPTLLLVLASAAGVTAIAFRFILRQPRPRFAERFELPVQKSVDRRLVAGAAIFGVGWGLGGYCPGPGVAALAMGCWLPLVFVAGMVGGMLVFRRLQLQPPRDKQVVASS